MVNRTKNYIKSAFETQGEGLVVHVKELRTSFKWRYKLKCDLQGMLGLAGRKLGTIFMDSRNNGQ